ncbi:MAG: hypothetical protein DMG11_29215 [Acidobacteria bacterium]|nr:MAG: hypothetical protein DMG11_29215 [Acidobacteriota bacterium]
MLPWIGIVLTLWTGQTDERPAYVREGDRIEQQFRAYRDRLNQFLQSLRGAVRQTIAADPGNPATAATARLWVSIPATDRG